MLLPSPDPRLGRAAGQDDAANRKRPRDGDAPCGSGSNSGRSSSSNREPGVSGGGSSSSETACKGNGGSGSITSSKRGNLEWQPCALEVQPFPESDESWYDCSIISGVGGDAGGQLFNVEVAIAGTTMQVEVPASHIRQRSVPSSCIDHSSVPDKTPILVFHRSSNPDRGLFYDAVWSTAGITWLAGPDKGGTTRMQDPSHIYLAFPGTRLSVAQAAQAMQGKLAPIVPPTLPHPPEPPRSDDAPTAAATSTSCTPSEHAVAARPDTPRAPPLAASNAQPNDTQDQGSNISSPPVPIHHTKAPSQPSSARNPQVQEPSPNHIPVAELLPLIVTVPQGVQPGGHFFVQIGTSRVKIGCPEQSGAGSTLAVTVDAIASALQLANNRQLPPAYIPSQSRAHTSSSFPTLPQALSRPLEHPCPSLAGNRPKANNGGAASSSQGRALAFRSNEKFFECVQKHKGVADMVVSPNFHAMHQVGNLWRCKQCWDKLALDAQAPASARGRPKLVHNGSDPSGNARLTVRCLNPSCSKRMASGFMVSFPTERDRMSFIAEEQRLLSMEKQMMQGGSSKTGESLAASPGSKIREVLERLGATVKAEEDAVPNSDGGASASCGVAESSMVLIACGCCGLVVSGGGGSEGKGAVECSCGSGTKLLRATFQDETGLSHYMHMGLGRNTDRMPGVPCVSFAS